MIIHDPPHPVRSEWSPDQCRLCWLRAHDPRYARLANDPPPAPCRHLGVRVGELIPEKTGCGCQGRPAVFECQAAGEEYAVQLAPGWFGVTLDVHPVPASVIDWRAAPASSRVRVRSCLGCPLRNASPPPQRWERWSVAVTTAPRRIPTLAATLSSIERAGWARHEVVVCAEPETEVPDGWTVEFAPERLGAWKNMVRALERALARAPAADAILLLQDDVDLAAGLRQLLEQLGIPADAGIVSPYCPAVYHPEHATSGLFPVRPGSFKGLRGFGLIGALTLAMSRATAEQFLQDDWIRRFPWDRWVDGAFGHWCHRSRRRPYFHSPSLVRHTGETSTIHGAARATGHRQADTWIASLSAEQFLPRQQRRDLRIGVIGWATASGLGRLNWEACANLPVLRWLAPRHPRFPYVARHPDVDMWYCNSTDNTSKLDAFLAGLDLVLCFELPYYRDLARRARRLNVRSVVVAMHECTPPGARGWPQQVDLVVAPNDECYRQLSPAMPRGNLRRQNWPIDVDAIPFRQRTSADVFFFGQGTGGGQDRKGGRIIQRAAELTPDIPWIVRSQITDRRMRISEVRYEYPGNVRHLGPVEDPASLYDAGDVAVQPSRYEGLGLQLLEAQAAGMPLITTDAGPMNEYGAWRLVPGTPRRTTVLRPTTAWDVSPEVLAQVIREVQGQDIADASVAARDNVDKHWSWSSQRSAIVELLGEHVFAR